MLYCINSLPTHLIAGVRKSATSWIWKQICDRGEVSTYDQKETHYFDHNKEKNLGWYKQHFKPNRLVVDCTPDYFSPGFAERINKALPHVKVLVCLRNPIERAFSQWKFDRYVGMTPVETSFLEAWNKNLKGVKSKGLYDVSAAEFKQVFGSRFEVVYYDELISDAWSFIGRVYNFLGIQPQKTRFFDKKWLPRVDEDKQKLQIFQQLNGNKKMTEKEKEILIKYYKDSVFHTSNILDKDLSIWLK